MLSVTVHGRFVTSRGLVLRVVASASFCSSLETSNLWMQGREFDIARTEASIGGYNGSAAKPLVESIVPRHNRRHIIVISSSSNSSNSSNRVPGCDAIDDTLSHTCNHHLWLTGKDFWKLKLFCTRSFLCNSLILTKPSCIHKLSPPFIVPLLFFTSFHIFVLSVFLYFENS